MPPELKEIGGYLELDRHEGNHYHRNAVALDCGRSCISYLVELRNIKTMWLPDYLCGSVSELLARKNVIVKTYKVGSDLAPDLSSVSLGEEDYLLLADYYGQLDAITVEAAFRVCSGRLIIDETQGFYVKPWHNADVFYNCRKWFGVADGAYLYSKDNKALPRELPIGESWNHMNHLLGRYERSGEEFYSASLQNEARLIGIQPEAMSLLTANLMCAIDHEKVRKRRSANWDALHEKLSRINSLRLKKPTCPFMYPLFLGEKAQIVRRELITRKIFVPMLWPDVAECCSPASEAFGLATGIVPLPLDQRYCLTDMGRVISAISEVLKCL